MAQTISMQSYVCLCIHILRMYPYFCQCTHTFFCLSTHTRDSLLHSSIKRACRQLIPYSIQTIVFTSRYTKYHMIPSQRCDVTWALMISTLILSTSLLNLTELFVDAGCRAKSITYRLPSDIATQPFWHMNNLNKAQNLEHRLVHYAPYCQIDDM